jgi:hypothetical protein
MSGKSKTRGHARRQIISFSRLAGMLSILGLVMLSYLAGAAVMNFGWFPSAFLHDAFTEADSWLSSNQQNGMGPGELWKNAKVKQGNPVGACNGYTLITTSESARAVLVDMEGRVVHQWKMPSVQPWAKAFTKREPVSGDPIKWERCHLYPNGDLLALCTAGLDTPYGYGLVKLDRDSKVLWGRSCNAHHDIALGEDGRIYVVTDKTDTPAPAEVDSVPNKYTAEILTILSADGQIVETIPLLEAFLASPYHMTVLPKPVLMPQQITLMQAKTIADFHKSSSENPALPNTTKSPHNPAGAAPPGVLTPPAIPDQAQFPVPPQSETDFMHTNSLMVLSEAMAKNFPLFKAGQVLISLRSVSALAVLDVPSRKIVWASRGVWEFQHCAKFLDNGHILLFDNFGSRWGSRVLEYDPVSQTVPWSFGGTQGTSFVTVFRGQAQRLANGNTLIVDSEGCRVFEVTVGKETVWEWSFPMPPTAVKVPRAPDAPILTGARKYCPTELTFLKGNSHDTSN